MQKEEQYKSSKNAAFLLITTNGVHISFKVAQRLRLIHYKQVIAAEVVTGEHNIIVTVEAETQDEIERFADKVSKITGVIEVKVAVVLQSPPV